MVTFQLLRLFQTIILSIILNLTKKCYTKFHYNFNNYLMIVYILANQKIKS